MKLSVWSITLRTHTSNDDLESLVRKGCSKLKANTTCVALPGILVSAGVIFALALGSVLLLLSAKLLLLATLLVVLLLIIDRKL